MVSDSDSLLFYCVIMHESECGLVQQGFAF